MTTELTERADTAVEHDEIDLLSLMKEEFNVSAMAFFAPIIGTRLALRRLKTREMADSPSPADDSD